MDESLTFSGKGQIYTVEPRFNKPLNIPCPSNNRIFEKEPKYDETSLK